MIDPIKLKLVEEEIQRNFPIPDMFNQILGYHGNLNDGMVSCPFHGEKTGSFSYAPHLGEHGVWKCFGECQTGGDTIDLYRFDLEKNHGIRVNKSQAVLRLMKIPQIAMRLTIEDIKMEEQTHENVIEYLNFMHQNMHHKKIKGTTQRRVKAVNQVRMARSKEEFKQKMNELLKVNMGYNEGE